MNGNGGHAALVAAFILLLAAAALCVRAEFAGAAVFSVSAAVTAMSALHCRGEIARMRAKLKAMEEEADMRAMKEHDKSVEALSEAKEQILRYHALISHGLRIPISIIMGYAEILMGKMVMDEATRGEYVRKMCEKAAYMNELLSYSLLEMRYNTGTFSSTHKRFELPAALRGVVDAMRGAAAEKGVEIRMVSECGEIFVCGNASGLSKVFYNIIENALKYMGRPGNLNITVARTDESEALIVFKDDGLGLPAEETERIFERNLQGKNARDGDGLGLWIAKVEVESHGGSIAARSDEGKGMGIYITLPAAPALPLAPAERKTG